MSSLLSLIEQILMNLDFDSVEESSPLSEDDNLQIRLFLHLLLDILIRDQTLDFGNEEMMDSMFNILQYLVSKNNLGPDLRGLYREPEKFGKLIKVLTSQLYNSKVQEKILFILNKLCWFTPTEEIHQFNIIPLCHALDHVLKMKSDFSLEKQNSFYLLSNLVLDFRCIEKVLINKDLFEKTGMSFMNGSDEVRREIMIFLGNICHEYESKHLSLILENNILEILKIGFDFESIKIQHLILQSFHLFFQKFINFEGELSKETIEKILVFANDEEFLNYLEKIDNICYREMTINKDQAKKEFLELMNSTYEIRDIMGLEK